MEFWDGYSEDPTATNIEADIYALTPILPPYLPGDYNFDGHVDAADYARWRSLYGNDISLDSNADADGSGNGVVDAADYVIWRKSLGSSAGAGAGTSGTVPEPATSALLLLGAVLGGGLRCRLPKRVSSTRYA
jgi:hypothetical protein